MLLAYSIHLGCGFAWALDGNKIIPFEIPEASGLQADVQRLRSTLSHSDYDGFCSAAFNLFRSLIGPAEELIQNKRRIVVVPDGALCALPFQLLLSSRPDGGRRPLINLFNKRWNLPYLGNDRVISYAQSAAVFCALNAGDLWHCMPENQSLLAVAPGEFAELGLSPLPGSLDEVRQIAATFPTSRVTILREKEARRDLVLSRMAEHPCFVHLATHAAYSDEEAQLALWGSNKDGEGWLNTVEIETVSCPAKLVVLSACDTAQGPADRAEGLMSFARAFLCSGAESVCGSFWPVSDVATAYLMKSFYSGIFNGAARSDALWLAERETRKKWNEPRCWGGFGLFGGL